jgi:hypothetical protein
MYYQAYLAESETIKNWVEHFKAKLVPFYEGLKVLINELGAKTANLSHYTKINGFAFDKAPKGWKLNKHGVYMPSSVRLKKKIQDLQDTAPNQNLILDILDWKSYNLNGELISPSIDFIGDDTVLRHPLFAYDEGNCFGLYRTEGLKEVTESEIFRLREKLNSEQA